MTTTKKLVAILLSLLLAVSSFSVMASAVGYVTDVNDPYYGYVNVLEADPTLSIKVRFADSNGNELDNLSTVTPGDSLKARVYVGTNFYSSSGNFVLFYDKAFFTAGISSGVSALTVNPANTNVANDDVIVRAMQNPNYGTDTLNAIVIQLKTSDDGDVFIYDDTVWLFEFNMTVKNDATGEGNLYADEDNIMGIDDADLSHDYVMYAYQNDPISEAMDFSWLNKAVTADYDGGVVTTDNTVTFDANGGYWGNASVTEQQVSGTVGGVYNIPANPTRDGYTFLGWTLNNADALTGQTTFTMPVDTGVEYVAKWNQNVTIHFADTGVATFTDIVVSGGSTWTDADKPDMEDPDANPGYKFMGWDGEGVVNGELPDTYPVAVGDVTEYTYTALWAKYIEISFDANGGTFTDGNEGTYSGDGIYAGASWTDATGTDAVPKYNVSNYSAAGISRDGYALIGWQVNGGETIRSFPDVFPDDDVEYTAVWRAKSVRVIYVVDPDADDPDDVNIATAPVVKTISVPYGSTYEFYSYTCDDGDVTSWTAATDHSEHAPGATVSMVSPLVTCTNGNPNVLYLIGIINPDANIATFDPAGGTWDDTTTGNKQQSVNVGDNVTIPGQVTREGYVFEGWAPEPGIMGDEDVTFVAQWNPIEITLSYKNNYDSSDDTVYETATVSIESGFELPQDPEREGYEFGGWYTVASCTDGSEFESFDDITEGMTAFDVYAKWEILSFEITYDANGGEFTGTPTNPAEFEFGATFTDAEPEVTRTGYTYDGWIYTDEDSATYTDATMPAKDLTATAQWIANTYTITYEKDGGTWTDANAEDYDTFTYDDAVTVRGSADIEKVGYTFNKVTLDAAGETVFTGSYDQIIANAQPIAGGAANAYGLTVYVQWNVNPYELTVELDGGAFAASATDPAGTYNYGTAFPEMPEPGKTGYTFADWVYTNTDTDEVISEPATMPAFDVTATATWNINSYDINYDANGGDFAGTPTNPASVVYDTVIPAEPEVSRDGYTFGGWVYTDAGDNEINVTSGTTRMPAYDLTATAQWDANTYIITYVPNEGTWKDGVTGASDTYVYDAAVTVRGANTIEKTGYTFRNVTIDEEGNTVFTGSYDQIIANATLRSGTTYGLTVYVQWDINQYTITVNPDGGSIETLPQGWTTNAQGNYEFKADYGTAVPALSNPTKTGYTFGGWDGTIPSAVPAEDVTVNAQWTINKYKITVNPDGGSIATLTDGWAASGSNYVFEDDYGAAVATLSDPTKTGYTFTGWDDTIPSTIPAENVTIKAQWQINQYTVTIDPDGGSIETLPEGWTTNAQGKYEFKADYGTAVTAPTAPTKTGYTFDGWDATIPSTIPAEDVTIKAKWKVNQYYYTLDLDGGSIADGETYTDTGRYDYGTAIIAPPTDTAKVTKTGFTFAGWDKTIPATMPAEDITIKALWTRNTYEVTYSFEDENGDAVPGASKASATVLYEGDVDVTAPEVYGFTYDGTWTADPSLLTGNKMPADDVEITFNYTANTHTLTVRYVDADKADISTATDATVSYNKAVSLPEQKAIEHYTFDSIEYPDGYTAGDPMPNNDLIILYVYNLNENTLSFTVDGVEAVNEQVAYGADITGKVPTVTPATGYKWEGKWYSDANCSVEVTIPATMPDENAIFYTKTEKDSFTLTWVIGDAEIKSGEVVFEEPIDDYKPTDVEIAAFAPSGKYFDGTWSAYDTMPAGNTTITGAWSDEEYTFKFVDNAAFDVTNTTPDTTVIATDTYSALPAPANIPEGYSFAGYQDVNDASKVYDSVNSGTTAFGDLGSNGDEITVKPLFTVNQYSITYYDSDNTTVLETKTEDYGTAITPTAATVTDVEGYTFAGTWTYKTDAGVECDPQPATYPAENLKAYPDFSINTYKYIFVDEQQGTVTPEIEEEYGTAITKPTPVKAGWEFAAWCTDQALQNDYNFPGNMPALGDGSNGQTMTLYARWIPADATYTITVYTMNTDGTTYTAAPAREFGGTSDDVLTLADLVEKIGTPAQGFEVNDTLSAASFTVAEGANYDLYIDRSTYVYTLDLDGGSFGTGVTDPSGSYIYGAAVATVSDPVRANYNFKGWDAALITEMPNEDVTITAQWKHYTEITVIRDLDNPEICIVRDVEQGDSFTPAAAVDVDGYTFIGYATSTDADPDDAVTVITAGTEDEITYYPIYEVHKYDVIFKLNAFNTWDDEIDATAKWADDSTGDYVVEDVAFGTLLSTIAPAAPSRTGYNFNGWNYDISTTMPDDEVEIEAQWEVHTNDVIFVWYDNDGVEHEMPAGDNWYDVDFGDTVDDCGSEPGEREGWHFIDEWLEETDGIRPEDYEYMPDRDLKFIAQYERNEYEYELVLDGGEFPDGTEYTPSGTYLYEATITSPTADPVKTGYTFDEWDPEIPANMPADDLTVTAQWIANTYKINYVKNGGTWTDANAEDYDVFTYDEDVSVRGQSDIEKTGYSFDKVTVDAAGETAFTGSYDQIIANAAPVSGGEANEYEVIVYVQWSVNDYELTIELDGGAFDEGVESPAGRYDFGEAFPEMPNPKKAGYDFRGWEYINAESDPTEVISKPATMPAYDVAATALWEKHVYTVVYAMNGGTPQLSNTSVEYDSLLTLPVFGTDFDKTGSSFSGWKCSVDDAVYNDNFRVPALATNGDTIIFTAQWDMIFYKITLDLDGGSVETPTQGWALENGNYVFTDVYNAQVNEPAVPEKAGYDFTGWYTEGNEKYTFTTMPNENIDLTAGWTPHKYNVVFLQPDDGATEPVFNDKAGFDYAEVYYGTGTTAPAEYPELQYYVPQGWATSTDGEIVDFSTWTMPAADKNSDFYFYPVFEREAITLQITSDNADVIRTSDTLPVNGYIYNAGNRLTKAKLSAQLEVTGNGSLRITPSKGVNICGTGTKVELVDNVTGEVVEAYYLVVCGDVNGDAVCNANDVSIAENALNKENSNWYLADEDGATEEQIAENARIRECYVKAADVTDNHGTFDDYDTALMELYVFGMATYDYDSTEHVYVAEAK